MIRLLQGDCRVVLPGLAERFECCVTDPPYNLDTIQARFGKPGAAPAQFGSNGYFGRASKGFMGQEWDNDVAFRPETWRIVFDRLLPGAWVLAFGGTRTYHRLASAIEGAGFQVRDAIMWHYGSGMPKSHNVSLAIDKHFGVEREIVGTQRLQGNGKTLRGHNYNGGNPDALVHETRDLTEPATDQARQWAGWGTALKPATEIICVARKPVEGSVADNVLWHGVGGINIEATRIEHEGDLGSWGSGRRPGGFLDVGAPSGEGQPNGAYNELGRWPANVAHDGSDEVLAAFPNAPGQMLAPSLAPRTTGTVYGKASGPRNDLPPRDKGGSAARFFYHAKVSKKERNGSPHPTMKPIALMRWLVRMVCPPGGTVLDPFAGTASTGMAALAEGVGFVGIEADPVYHAFAHKRLGLAPTLAEAVNEYAAAIRARTLAMKAEGL